METCDADLRRPFGGSVQHTLFDLLHLCAVCRLIQGKHFLYQLKDLWFVSFSDLHAVLQDHDDVLSSVLRPVFGALFCSSWREINKQREFEKV